LRTSILLLSLLLPASARGEDGLAAMERIDRAMRSEGESMTVRMEVVSASGSTDARQFRMWQLSPVGKPARALIRFESPAGLAGLSLLTVTRSGGGLDTWLYMPSLGRTRRIAAADRTESFAQSDFTLEDMSVGVDAKKRVYTVLGEADCSGRPCLMVEDKPIDEAAGKESGYGRVVLYADKAVSVVHRVDFYDRDGSLVKVLKAGGLKQVGSAWRFDTATLTHLKKGSKTVMTVLARHGEKVDESIFSPSALEAM
jgi:hypothetical protein